MNNYFRNIYMIGIKGAGMTMLADFLAQKGAQISGSDTGEVFMTDAVLKKHNTQVFENFNAENIPENADLIVYSTAYNSQNNAEVARIFEPDFQTSKMSYPEALATVFNQSKGVAICGSHGKTTLTAWAGFVLRGVGLSPNALVGARVPQFDGASLAGESEYLVAEVDEYQNKMRFFNPHGVVLNNIDYDHPDFFADFNQYKKVFADFVIKIASDGFLIYNCDDENATLIANENFSGEKINYSLKDATADYFAQNFRQDSEKQIFEVLRNGKSIGDFQIQLSGHHNIANALAIIALCHRLGANFTQIKKFLGEFQGAERRMQFLGEFNNAIIYDDYAHHPSEVNVTLTGARERFVDKNLRVFFHPHTFTRTKALLDDFAKSFDAADEVNILDIYGSAREKQGGVSSSDLVDAIEKHNEKIGKTQKVRYAGDIPKSAEYIRQTATQNDLIILMGAGDVFRIWEKLKTKKIVF